MTKAEIAIEPKSTISGGAKCGAQSKYTNNGIAAAAASEPSETYRQYQTTSANSNTASSVARGQSAAKIPAAAATPLPPRNRNHTGEHCPTSAKNPATPHRLTAPCVTG